MKTILLFLCGSFAMLACASEFDAAWKDESAVWILDPFYANSINWTKLATEKRVVAIIHKATIGSTEVDPGYVKRKQEARSRGYLWGSYHWGVAGNPEKQADFYIDTVKPGADELIALDLEDAQSSSLMNADEAIRFIQRVKSRTGRYPLLYTNHASASLISSKYKGTVFGKTPLWYARFRSKVTNFPTGVSATYTLWQFSSEILPQVSVPGTRSDMDVNVYNGTAAQFRVAWPLTKTAP